MTLLDLLAKACAVLAGLLLTGITLMTCASLVGRNTTGWTIVGDFELTAYAAGAAIALFMPICQLRRANIIVDFFTVKARAPTRLALDRLGAALLAVVMALMAWRSALGLANAWTTQTGSMMLGVPDWWVHICIVPGLALTALIAAAQALLGFGDEAHP
jgi:TRAP-type C4-dicarboxylate transport system permease small subunit